MAQPIVSTTIIRNDFPRLGPQARARMDRLVAKTAFAIELRAKAKMLGPKGGRAYYRGAGNLHIASAPGEAPAVDLGQLIGSIRAHPVSVSIWEVSTNSPQGLYTELGTAFMAPRPWLRPSAEEQRPDFVREATVIVRLAG